MTPRLPALKSKKVLCVLQRAGFFIHHSTGSHRILKHREKPTLRITVPFHNKDRETPDPGVHHETIHDLRGVPETPLKPRSRLQELHLYSPQR